MNDMHSLTTIVDPSPIDLAIEGWLHEHGKRKVLNQETGELEVRHTRTSRAYEETINQYRAALRRLPRSQDLDSDVRTLSMIAQQFAPVTSNAQKEQASRATVNQRLAILSSFYTYALSHYLLAPMDDAGHILNPIKIVKREKVQRYAGVHALAPDDAMKRLKQIDRSTPLGKRDYALLAILFQTGRRLQEVTLLQWRHVSIQAGKVTLTFENCKGGKTMVDTLPLGHSKALLAWLYTCYGSELTALDKNAPLWVTLSRNTKQAGKPLGIQAVQQICEKYLETHTHVTRHTFAHNMIKAGATLPELQARLGHESLATTGIYAQAVMAAENPHADKLASMLGIEEAKE